MKTGLPLMPAATPVSASGPPSSRARIRSRFGPWMFFRTPMIWTLKSLSSVPSKTVRPTPTMPGLTSLSGMIGVEPFTETRPTAVSANTPAIIRMFMIASDLVIRTMCR